MQFVGAGGSGELLAKTALWRWIHVLAGDEAQLAGLSRFLRFVPRVGLGILIAIFVLMMIGASCI